MAEIVCSALVQEGLSRAISSVLGKREEKASQGHIMERLEMAASELEFALERSVKLPITDVSLLRRRKMIKCAYVEATELLDKHKKQAVQGQVQLGQMTKRRLWMIKDPSVSSFVDLNTDGVRRFEWFADCAGKFVRDVESGCSLRHYTFCSPLVRHLLEGKGMVQESPQRDLCIWSMCSEERGVEAVLGYDYKDPTAAHKSFYLLLVLRLSESTDIVAIAMKCLELLTVQFKLVTETAMGQLRLVANLQGIPQSCVAAQEMMQMYTKQLRPDPLCCKQYGHGPCANNNVPSEISLMLPEQVILFTFDCYISDPAGEYNLQSSTLEARRRAMKDLWSPLKVTLGFTPHTANEKPHMHDLECLALLQLKESFAVEFIGDTPEVSDISIQQGGETVRSKAINCFLRQPELTEYRMQWVAKHGGAYFEVEKPRSETAGVPKTRRYNTRGSTKRST